YHDRSDGGLLATVAEMAFAGHCGVDLQLAELLSGNGDVIRTLFNEEIGVVLQIARSELNRVLQMVEQMGLSDCCSLIGSVKESDELRILNAGKLLFEAPRVSLQREWAATSYQIQSLRDNPECAKQEFDTILEQDDPGLHSTLSFDQDEDITAPFINLGARPRVAVLREQGVNGQVEMAAAFDRARFDAVDVHMTDMLSGKVSLEEFNVIVA